jgi:hypothetical protein
MNLKIQRSTEKILKARLRRAFKIFSGFQVSAKRCTFAGVAQLAEHLSCKQNVTGSIPVISLKPVIEGSYGAFYYLTN